MTEWFCVLTVESKEQDGKYMATYETNSGSGVITAPTRSAAYLKAREQIREKLGADSDGLVTVFWSCEPNQP
jgi:hypothetical protein